MRQKVSYTLVGLFTIVLGGAFIAITMWMVYGDLDKVYRTYLTYMTESVSGLNVDAAVKFRGVVVGKVRAIELSPLDPEKIKVTLAIEKHVPIKEDTLAILSVQPISGIATIDLTGGTRAAQMLGVKPGEKYPVINVGPSLFVRMDTAITELLTNLNAFTEDARVLMQPESWEAFQRTLASMEVITGTLAEHKDELGRSLRSSAKLLENSVQISDQLPQLLNRVSDSAQAMERMANNIANATGGIDKKFAGSVKDLELFTSQTLPEVNRLVGDLRHLTSNVDRFTRQVEEEPRLFLYGRKIEAPGPGE